MRRSTLLHLLLSTLTSSSFRETGALPISDDESTVLGEEPPQRDTRRRRDMRRNVRQHHEARQRDHRQAQERERELAEQDARLRRENPLLTRNLYPDFARALNTPSEVGAVLA